VSVNCPVAVALPLVVVIVNVRVPSRIEDVQDGVAKPAGPVMKRMSRSL
jgi:hypothetical protein